jgi:putative membrane protein (TIGR04086 family)
VKLNWGAVVVGALSAAVIVIPAAVLNTFLVDDDGTDASGWVLLSFLVILIGFFIGGLVAGDRERNTPLMHGAAAAFLAYAVIQGLFILKLVISGDGVESWIGVVFLALLSASTGMAGGLGASWLQGRRMADARYAAERQARREPGTQETGGA